MAWHIFEEKTMNRQPFSHTVRVLAIACCLFSIGVLAQVSRPPVWAEQALLYTNVQNYGHGCLPRLLPATLSDQINQLQKARTQDNLDPPVENSRPNEVVWHLETVDSVGNVGSHTSLALDSAGFPHISYYDATNQDLKYARYDGANWQIETVDSDGNVGRATSLALDPHDQPHISYRGTSGHVNYATYNGTSWSIETVDTITLGSIRTSLALDSAGQPHIAYATAGYDLKYAYYDGVAWHTEIADPSEEDWNGCSSESLAIDTQDYPHIAHPVAFMYGYWVEYLRRDGTSWSQLWNDIDGLGFTSLELDSADQPHISYLSTDDELRFSYQDGANWYTEIVDNVGTVGAHTTLVLDGADWPHIGYCQFSNSDFWCNELRYAYQNELGWTIEVVDATGQVGEYGSMALNGAGWPHISYYDRTNGDLKYAYRPDCVPLEAVTATGPLHLPAGITGLYTATHEPPSATLPVDYTWDNGDEGPTSTYSWTIPGVHSLHVTGTNDCGQAGHTLGVHIFCQPPTGLSISGTELLLVEAAGTFTATYEPPTASLPLTLTWDNGGIGPSAVYSWTVPGVYAVTATAKNPCGEASGAFTVTVCDPVAILSVTTAISGCVVDLGAALTGTAPFIYDWDFGPFGSSSAPTPTVDFLSDGTYAYGLTAYNCGGAFSDTFASEVTVSCGITCAPVTNTLFSWMPLTPTVDQAVTLSASAAGTPPITYTWRLDAGTWRTGSVVTYSYSVAGDYSVTMTATNCLTATQAVVHTLTVVAVPPEYLIYLPLVLRNW
jgi:hypothetical protein